MQKACQCLALLSTAWQCLALLSTSGLVSGGAMAPLAPPLTRPLVLSKAKHCKTVLSKAKHWHAVMSEVPFKKKSKKESNRFTKTVTKRPGWNQESAIEWRSNQQYRTKLF